MTELLLVRHGESQANLEQRWASWEAEVPLSPQGQAEAEALARRMAFERGVDALYASPLLRAQQTAEHIARALGLSPIMLPGLCEINVGQVAGLTNAEFAQSLPDVHARWQNRDDSEYTWPGGEKRADFFHRVAQTVEGIVAAHPAGKVAVVCHGGVIRATLAHYLPATHGQWWAYRLHTGSLTRLLVAPDGNALLALNEHEELSAD